MIVFGVILLMFSTTPPLLNVTDTMARGATAVYTVSVNDETLYQILLESVNNETNFDIVTSSSEMDFDHFMSLPYGDDFLYALEFSIAAGQSDGDESLTIPARNSGLVYVIIHDTGGNGGLFKLLIK